MYIMSWTFPSRAFGILLGVLCDLGNLPLNRFWRHVFWQMAHMHLDGSFVKSKHGGGCL